MLGTGEHGQSIIDVFRSPKNLSCFEFCYWAFFGSCLPCLGQLGSRFRGMCGHHLWCEVYLGFVGTLCLQILKTLVSESILNIFQCRDFQAWGGLHIRIVLEKEVAVLLKKAHIACLLLPYYKL